MTDVINLRRERKRRKAEEDARMAASNRILFGRTKGEKLAGRREEERKISFLDGRMLEREGGEKETEA